MRLESELGLSVEDGDLAAAATVGELLRLVEAGEAVSPPARVPVLGAPAPGPRGPRPACRPPSCFPLTRSCAGRSGSTAGSTSTASSHPSSSSRTTRATSTRPSILRALPRRLRARVAVAAAADYFFRTRLLAVATPLLLNAFPFSREGSVRSSLEHCGDLADQGWSVLVYPEGTRSPDGRLQPFRTGIGLLATDLRVPVVPVGVEGTHAALPKGRRRPRRGPVTVRFGVPLQPRAARRAARPCPLSSRPSGDSSTARPGRKSPSSG